MRTALVYMIVPALISQVSFAKLSPKETENSNQNNQLEISVRKLAATPYAEASESLRSMADSKSEKTLHQMDISYAELKAQGNQNPTVADVADKHREKFKNYKSADLIMTCVILLAGAGGVAAIDKGINKVIDKARRDGYRQGVQDQKAGCAKPIAQLNESIAPATATATGASRAGAIEKPKASR